MTNFEERTTRNGSKARIYATDGGGAYPIHGAIWDEAKGRWVPKTWTKDGRHFNGGDDWSRDRDLMPDVPKGWVNVYPDQFLSCWLRTCGSTA